MGSFEELVKELYSTKSLHEDHVKKIEKELFRKYLQIEGRELRPQGPPVDPMLARPIVDIEKLPKLLAKFNDTILVEMKYDGERVLMHWDGLCFNIYSRSGESANIKYTNFHQKLQNGLKNVSPFILDGELVPIDPISGKILAFSALQKMPRKYSVQGEGQNVEVYVYDCLYAEGKELVNEEIEVRKKAIPRVLAQLGHLKIVHPVESFVCSRSSPNFIKNIIDHLENAKNAKFEGLMLKPTGPTTVYVPGSRTQWIKLKAISSVAPPDTVDLVVMGVYLGTVESLLI